MKLKLALLNMYEGHPNQGMRAIREILAEYEDHIDWHEYDVRVDNEVPDLTYDIYLTSGGPGHPLEGNGVWDVKWAALIEALWNHNKSTEEESQRKHVFFICHSFQMACHLFGLGTITRRVVTSFGIYPCHKTVAGKSDWLLNDLDDPYYVVDSRDYQLVQPRLKVFEEHGAKILSLEKMRSHLLYERAIMAVRFSDEFVGTQYHPEADPHGMTAYFAKPEIKEGILKNYSVRKYNDMVRNLEKPERILRTQHAVIPSFLNNAIAKLTAGKTVLV